MDRLFDDGSFALGRVYGRRLRKVRQLYMHRHPHRAVARLSRVHPGIDGPQDLGRREIHVSVTSPSSRPVAVNDGADPVRPVALSNFCPGTI